jgi:ribosomal protein S18 acetylase RimI-like enzyme
MTPAPHWIIEPLSPATPGQFTAADLAPLEPLWRSLMDRHRDVWNELPMRSYEESWERRRAQYLEVLAVPGSFILVARRGEHLIGYAMVDIQEGDETYTTGERQAEIYTLAVLPGERERGVGAALMDEADRRLLADGVTDVFVATMHGNDAAQRFYERRGFTPFLHMQYRKLTGLDGAPAAPPPSDDSRQED